MSSKWNANLFDQFNTDPTNRYDVALKVFNKAQSKGFVLPDGSLNFGQGSQLANDAKSAMEFFTAEGRRGTPERRQRQREETRLLDFLDGSGQYYTRPQYDKDGRVVGTALMWKSSRRSDPFHGKPVALAVSGDANAKVGDFAAVSGTGFAEGLKRNLFSERFHDIYFAVYGQHVPEYPTEDEMDALREMQAYRDAAIVVGRGDPRKAGKQDTNGGARK